MDEGQSFSQKAHGFVEEMLPQALTSSLVHRQRPILKQPSCQAQVCCVNHPDPHATESLIYDEETVPTATGMVSIFSVLVVTAFWFQPEAGHHF